MRIPAFFLVPFFVIPAFSSRPLTVVEFKQMVSGFAGRSDAECARLMADVRLTARLDEQSAVELRRTLPGEKSRDALIILADQSAFLALSSSQLGPQEMPSVQEQRQIMALVVSYVTQAIPKLPDFLATRTLSRFEDEPAQLQRLPGSLPAFEGFYKPLHRATSSVTVVSYQSGREEIGTGKIAVSANGGFARGESSGRYFLPSCSMQLKASLSGCVGRDQRD